jgi:hypothetical protein
LYFLLRRKGISLWGFAVANAIFYFNTFFINHQIHFNMIMALYLIPTAFLVADLFIEKRKLRYIFFQSLILANSILWGHAQSTVIIFMGIFFYMLVFSFKKMRFRTFLFYFAFLAFLTIIETLPQILPTYEMLGQSARTSDFDYLKGSLRPRMVIFSFVPYLFGTHDNFFGMSIKEAYTYTDMYTYLGISSVILSFLALLFLKKSRETILAFIFIWLFLVFGFMSSHKIFSSDTPIISLFREWNRVAALSSFGIAILAGILVDKLKDLSFKNIRWGILFVLSPAAYIWTLIKIKGGTTVSKIDFYTSYQYIQTYPFFPILKIITLSLAGVLLAFFAIKKMFPNFSLKTLALAKIIILGIVFFDLIYFSKDVLAWRLIDTSFYKIPAAPAGLENKRVILNSLPILGGESLFYENWSPFGRSQLKEKEYLYYYNNKVGIKLRGTPTSTAALPDDYQKLSAVGIVAVVKDDKIDYINKQNLDLIKNDVPGQYIQKSEGRVIMQIDNPEDATISTYLKYSPYWKVQVDGQNVKINKNGLFFDFPLAKGNHLVKISYFPKPFFGAVLFGLISGIIAYAILKKYEFAKKLLA